MMDVDEDDILRTMAAGGSMDYSLWPSLSPRILDRILKICREEYPMPPVPPDLPWPLNSLPTTETDPPRPYVAPSPPPDVAEPGSPRSSQDTNKENSPVVARASVMSIPPPLGPIVEPKAAELVRTRYSDWPQPIAIRLAIITTTWESNFPKYPPHTMQRLSELLLEPKRHYRSLPAFIHAIDRVVHVTSGLNVYPLPPAAPENNRGTMLTNGAPDGGPAAAPSPWATPGSDEALGGALLTPIPWLSSQPATASPPSTSSATATPDPTTSEAASADMEGQVRTESTETIEGPNGMGSVETVSVSVNGVPSMGARGVGVTQGELLRQEQKAGVVPVSQLVPSHHARHQGSMMMQQQRLSSASPGGAASGSSSSSDTLEEDARTTPDEMMTGDESNNNSSVSGGAIASVPAVDEEKPHARGPEEIGPEDTGPQPDSTGPMSLTGASGPNRVDLQGINVEAAVGRKAADAHPPSTSAKSADDMDVEKDSSNDDDKKKDDDKGAAGGVDGADATKSKEEEKEEQDEDAAMTTQSTTTQSTKTTTEEGDKMDVDESSTTTTTVTSAAKSTTTTTTTTMTTSSSSSSTSTVGRSRETTPKREADEDLPGGPDSNKKIKTGVRLYVGEDDKTTTTTTTMKKEEEGGEQADSSDTGAAETTQAGDPADGDEPKT